MGSQSDIDDLLTALKGTGDINDLRRALDGTATVDDLRRALDAAQCQAHFRAYLHKLAALAAGVSEMKRLGESKTSETLKNAVYNTQLELGKLRAEAVACPDCSKQFSDFLSGNGVKP